MTCFTLRGAFQHAVADTFWNKPPLEHGMVGPTSAQHPLEVVGPADICDMCRMAHVLSKFGS